MPVDLFPLSLPRALRVGTILGGGWLAVLPPGPLTAQGHRPPADAVAQAFALTDTLPPDPAVTIGTLPNGLRYYIRVNPTPAHRAELRLVVHAGSLMEDDDQRGLAHFVEHMAFRGTTHFQGTQIVEYLKSIGVRFGADLNAGTDFDHTTYLLPIPTDTLAQLQQGLQILEEWAHGVAFRPQDIEEERGIVLSERRTDLGAQQRITDQERPLLFQGSRYAVRDPIGTEASVAHATRDQLVRFYHTWYRPDRMAVIAVGDFDPAQMERLIRAHFSPIPAPTTPDPAPTFPVPPQPGTRVAVVRDPEVPLSMVLVRHKEAPYQHRTVGDERAQLVRRLFDGMLNRRFAELLDAPDAPFLQAQVEHMASTPELGVADLLALVPTNGVARGLEGVLVAADRVAQQGFTAAELAREQASLLAEWTHRYDNRHDQLSATLVQSYVGNFLEGDAIPSVETEVGVDRQLLATITLAEVDREAGFWNLPDNRLLVVVQPEAADVSLPDTTALVHLFPAIAARTLAAYQDEPSTTPLLPSVPKPGRIVAEQRDPQTGITQWTLSNGAVVLLKPTPFQADEILFRASSPGGGSVLPDRLYPTAALLDGIGGAGGVGRFSPPALAKRLSGQVVEVEATVEATGESVQGSASRRDVETLLQLVYLRMTAPRYDSTAIAAFLQREAATLATQSADPGAVFNDTVQATLTRHSPRAPILTPALLAQVHPREAFATYRDRFADASGFTFLFVGAITPDSLRPLVERYLASLPALHRHERTRDRPVFHAPPGVVRATVTAGEEPRTTTVLHFTGPYEGNPRNAADVQVLVDLLRNRLNNLLREHLAGTYGVGVSETRMPQPINTYDITIQFDADPARRPALTRAVFAVIDSLQRVPPTTDELHRVIAPLLRTRERNRQTNQYWLSAVKLYEWGRPFAELLDDMPLTATTPARVPQVAQRYLDVRHYAEFDLLPAHAAPAPTTDGSVAPPASAPADTAHFAPARPVAEAEIVLVGRGIEAYPFLPVMIQGHPLTVVLDVGASVGLLLSPSAMGREGVPLPSTDSLWDSLTIGTTTLHHIPLITAEGIAPKTPPGLPPVVGLLGTAVLQHYDLVVDGPAHRVRLYAVPRGTLVRTVPREPPTGVSPPLTAADCSPLRQDIGDSSFVGLDLRVNGHPVAGFFDSGSKVTAMNLAEARLLGLRQSSPDVHRLPPDSADTYPATGVKTQTVYAWTGATITVGHRPLTAHPVWIYAQHPIAEPVLMLGLDAFRDRVVLVSYSSRQVCVSEAR